MDNNSRPTKNNNGKKSNFMPIAYFLGLVSLLSLSLFFLVQHLVRLESPLNLWGPISIDNDWIGYWGSFLGALLGAGATILAVRISADKQTENHKNELSVQRDMMLEEQSEILSAVT